MIPETALPLASLADTLMQLIMVLLLTAVCVAVVVVWLMLRRWGPALRSMMSMVEREVSQVERTAGAINQSANAQIKRVYSQGASVRGAIEGVHSLRAVITDLDQHTEKLKRLANQIAADPSFHGDSLLLARDASERAMDLTQTSKRAHQTYRKLLTSVQQLAVEADALRENGEEASRNAQLLTGAMERVRHVVRDGHAVPPEMRQRERATRSNRDGSGRRRDAASERYRSDEPERRPASAQDERDAVPSRLSARDDREDYAGRRPRGSRDESTPPLEDPRPPPRARRPAVEESAPPRYERDESPSLYYSSVHPAQQPSQHQPAYQQWEDPHLSGGRSREEDPRRRPPPDQRRRRPDEDPGWMR